MWRWWLQSPGHVCLHAGGAPGRLGRWGLLSLAAPSLCSLGSGLGAERSPRAGCCRWHPSSGGRDCDRACRWWSG